METDVRILEKSTANGSRKLAALLAPVKLSSPFTHHVAAGKRKYLVILVAALAAALFVVAAHAIGTDAQNGAANNSDQRGAANQSDQPSLSNNNAGPEQPGTDNKAADGKSSSSTTVTVNGQSVDVPQSGSYDKTVDVPGGQARVSGSNSSTTSGNSASNSSTSSTNVNVSSQ